jgi:hypothetical protein
MIQSDTEFLTIIFRCYDNPIITSIIELETDIRRFQYLNTAISRFKIDNDLSRLRIATNHVVIIGNCFGIENVAKLIRYKIDPENLQFAETILFFLKYIGTVESELDFKLLNKLESM